MTFEARYHSVCAACEEAIAPGQTVRWEDGQVIHADCDSVARDEPVTPVCPRCYLVLPLTGVCGCEP